MAQNIFSQLAQQTLSTATAPAGGGAAGDDDPTSAITAVAQEHGVNPNFLLGLAQLETRGGKATVKGQGVDSRNLFNIKDFSKAGTGIRALDKAEGSNDPYRRYDSASDSARDLVRLLGSKRYEGALTAQTPEEFAAALKRGGYATDPDHDKKVIATIRSIEAKGGTPAPAPAQPWDQGARYVPMEHMVPGGPPAHNPNKNPDFLRGAGDVGLSFLQGAAGSVKSLTDLAGAGNAVSRVLDDTSKELGKLKSEEAQQSLAYHQQKIKDAETNGDWKQEIGAYADMVWDMPADSLAQALGSLVTLGAGKAAQVVKLASSARRAGMTKEAFLKTAQGVEAAKKASNLGAGVNLGLGVGQGVGGVKGEQYERTYNAAKEEGLADDEAQALATEAQSYGKGWMQQAAGAALGYAAAKTGPLEKLASGQTVGAGGVLRRFAGGAAIESASEGGQGGQARYAGNAAAIDAGVLDESQRFAGVAGTAFSEGLLGGVVGGGAGALGRPDVDPLATTKEAAKKPNSPISRAAVAGQPAKPEQQPAQTPVAAGAGAQSHEADPTFAEMSDSVLLQLQRSLQERQAAGDEDITDDEIELAQAAKAEYNRRMASAPPAVPGSVTPPQPTTPQTNEAPAQPAGVSASEKVQPTPAKAQPAITVDLNPAPRAPSPFDAVPLEQDPAITQQQREDAAKVRERHRKNMAALRLGVYNKNPMMEFLGRHGLQPETQNEFAPGTTERRKASVYGYGPVFRQNGKPLDLLLSNAQDEGFLPPDASESDLYDLVARAINGERVEPLYKAGSADALMQRLAAEREAKEAASYEDFLAQQQALAADPDYDPFATFADTENDYDVSDLDNSGYSQAEKSLQAEVSALAQAYSQLGFDADDVLEPLATQYESNPDEYYAQARQRLTQLIAQAAQPRSNGNFPQDSGEQAQAPIGREAANATSAEDDALIDYAIEDDGEPDYFLQAQTARQLREREDAIAEQARLNAERQQALETKAQADDILSDNGKPFAFEYGAKLRAERDGGDVVQVAGGWAVRPKQGEATQADPVAGDKIDDEWTAFSEQSGTLGIPRAEMPQVKAQDRGAMVNFLKARGIDSSNEVMPARAIKPTQAEFSPAKVQKAAERTENQRSIIVSADGHVVDGHHQWMAQRQKGEPVKVIKLDQPIGQVLEALKGMPSAQPEQARDGATQAQQVQATTQDVAPQTTQEQQDAILTNSLPTDTAFKPGKGKAGTEKWIASAGDVSGNLSDSIADAAKSLAQFINSERERTDRQSERKKLAESVALKLKSGEQPTDMELRNLFGLEPGQSYVDQAAVGGFLVEHMGVPRNKIRESLGVAASSYTTDTGTKYPTVLPRKLHLAFGAAAVPEVGASAQVPPKWKKLMDTKAEEGNADFLDSVVQNNATKNPHVSAYAQGLLDKVKAKDTPKFAAGDQVRINGEDQKLHTIDQIGEDGWVYLKSGGAFPPEKAAEYLFKSEPKPSNATFGGSVSSPEDRTPSYAENMSRWRNEAGTSSTSQPDTSNRADSGGQVGMNGYFYKGGQFLPNTMAEPGKWKLDGKWVTGGREETAPNQFGYTPTPFSRSIYSMVRGWSIMQNGKLALRDGIRENDGSTQVTLNTEIRPGVRGVVGKESLTVAELIDAWNSGQRWFDVRPDAETITTQTEPQAQQPTQPTIDTSPAAKWRNNWEEAKRTAEGRNLRLPEMVPAIEALRQTDGVQQENAAAAVGTEAPSNPFGPILTQYRYDAQGAIKALTELKSGEAVAALHHPEVGDIDLVWGKAPEGGTDGFGLAKLVKKHPEVLQDLQGFLDRLHKDPKQSGKNRIRLIDNRGTAVVRLQWEGKSKKWLLTAFENNTPGATTRTDIGSLAIKDDTASLEAGSGQSLPTGPQLSNTLAESASEPAFPEQSELNEKREALGEREKKLAAESKANEAAQAQSNDVPSTEQQVSGFSRGFERSVQDGLSGGRLPPVATTVPSSSFAIRQLEPSTEVSGNSPPRMGIREVGAFLNKLAQADAVGHGRPVEGIPTIDGGEDVKGKQYSAKLEPNPELLSQVRERFQSVEDGFRAATGYGFDALTESEARYLAKHDNAQSVRDRIVEAGNAARSGLAGGKVGSPQGIKASRSRLTTPVTNTGLPTAQVEAVVRQLQSGWNNAPTVVVAQDLQDPRVPQAVRDENARQVAAGAEGAPEGFIHGETVYLVANQMGSPADAARVLLHEVVGHHGLRGVFGDTLSPILRDLANKRRREVVTMAIRQGLKPNSLADNASVADIYQAMTPAQREQAAEEVLAYMAQNQPELGFVRRAIAAIRQWLKSTFPTLGERLALTDGDIVANYILPARAFVENGRTLVQGGGQEAVRFSRAPTAPQPEQPPTWAAPKDTRWDYLTYNLQDRQIDTKRVQQSIEANNGPLPDELNVRQREELFYGRDAKEVQDFKTQELNPMLEQLGKDGIELPEFEEYLHARHAPEANRVMAQRNPNQAMIDQGKADAKRQIAVLTRQLDTTTTPEESKTLSRKLSLAIGDLARWRNVQPYTGTEESRLALSGMSNQQAQEIMDGLPPEKLAGMERSAAMFDAIVAKNRALMVEYGLEGRDTVEGWAGLFQHYVPLMREEAEGTGLHNGLGTGQGFSIKGREVKSRTGSAKKKVVDIVANLAMQRERTITRGEKNRVAATMIELARANPNPDFWKVGTPDRKRVYDRATRTVKWVTDPAYKQRDEVVVAKFVKDNGQIEEVALTFNKADPRAMRMATAFKNLDDASLNKPLRMMAPVTRTLAALSTQYNPTWGIFNFLRDTFGVMISLGNTPLSPLMPKKTIETDGSKTTVHMGSTRMRIYKDAFLAFPALYSGARMERKGKEDTSEWGQLWEDFQKVGGATGFRDMIRASNERTGQLKTVIDPDAWMETTWGKVVTAGGTIKPLAGKAERGRKALFDWVSDFNLGLENASRVATYKAALDQGLSKEQAASIAKNITVNFNRRGAVGHQIGAAYAFFNASVQGTARMAEAVTVMSRPGDPRSIRLTDFGKAVVYGGLAMGVLQALALAAAGFGDDEPPEFVRDRNLTIPTGWTGMGPDKGYITLPMPLGYNIIPAFGRRLTEFVLSGGKDPFKHASGLVGLVFEGFNPIGSGSFFQMLAPSVFDPIVAAIQNTDSFGRPIARETMDRNIPGHQLARDAATDVSRFLSRTINTITGGDEYTAGKLSPSPDQLDYVVGQYGGGVARELIKLWQLASGTARGEEVPFYKVPLLGRFAGSADSASSQGNAYYGNINKIDQAEKRIKGLTEDGKRSEAQAERRKPEAFLIAKAKVAQREVSRLRQEKRRLLETGAERAKVRAVEAKITDAMRRLNEAAKAQGI